MNHEIMTNIQECIVKKDIHDTSVLAYYNCIWVANSLSNKAVTVVAYHNYVMSSILSTKYQNSRKYTKYVCTT